MGMIHGVGIQKLATQQFLDLAHDLVDDAAVQLSNDTGLDYISPEHKRFQMPVLESLPTSYSGTNFELKTIRS